MRISKVAKKSMAVAMAMLEFTSQVMQKVLIVFGLLVTARPLRLYLRM